MERVLETDLYKADLFGRTMYIILNTNSDHQTDAIQRQPDLTVPINESGRVGYYQSATDTAVERHWRKKLGKWLYQDILKEEMARRGIEDPKPDLIYLAVFPLHYTLWTKSTGDVDDPRRDAYLWGSRWVHDFRSPAEFRLHLKWILEGQHMKRNGKPDCRCCYCDPSRTQGEISKALGMIHPNPDRKPGGRGGRGKGGGPGGKRRSSTNSGAITFKDYTKLNSGASS